MLNLKRFRRLARLAAAEALSASEGGPLTERTLRDQRAVQRASTLHIGSEVPGAEIFFDTFYVGRLKGVRKVWQYSAADGGSSFGWARAHAGEKRATTMAAFLEHDVLPTIAAAGRQLRRVTTDNGPEFGRVFSATCGRLGLEHHRIPPRSPNLNAFVERFGEHGAAPPLPHRLPLPLYTSAADIDADLAAWLRNYNFERPHRGYRTQGRTPGSLLFADRPAILTEMGA